jgi:hypothetical protein
MGLAALGLLASVAAGAGPVQVRDHRGLIDGNKPLVLSPVRASNALAVTGEPVSFTATLDNQSSRLLKAVAVAIELPEGWRVTPSRFDIAALTPYTQQAFRFTAAAGAAGHGFGHITVTSPDLGGVAETWFPVVSCAPLPLWSAVHELSEKSVGQLPEDSTLYVATGSYILFFPKCGDCYGPGLVYLRRPDQWLRVATIPAMGHLCYRDLDADGHQPVPVEHWVLPTRFWITPNVPRRGDVLVFKEQWLDGKRRWWTAKAYFAPTADDRVVKCTHMVWCTGAAGLLRYEGPMASVGDGTFGAANAGLIPPDGRPTTPGAALLKLADPGRDGLMAVETPFGGTLAMLWDPDQQWSAGHSRPYALLAAPNDLRRQDNTFLSLLVPPFGLRQSAIDAFAATPLELPEGRFVYLRSELFVTAAGSLDEVAKVYHERFAPGGPGRALLPDADVKTGQPDG